MKNVFFNNEVLQAEKGIIDKLKISSVILMENAGKNSADFILKIIKEKKIDEIIILAGKGNNAGDGFVIARHIAIHNLNVKLFLFYNEKEISGDALINFNIIKKNINIEITEKVDRIKKITSSQKKLFIDALFGIGFKGKLDKKYFPLFGIINNLENKTVVAIDTVSGLSHYNTNDKLIAADYTLSMGIKKFNSIFSSGRELSGKNFVMDIGISDKEFTEYNERKIFETEKIDMINEIPKRNINSNKYSNGKLFILSGSPGFTGASYLCSLSAMKTGCGAVILGIPESLNPIMESKTTEIITIPLKETEKHGLSLKSYKKIITKIKWADSVLIGPGLGRDEETMELVRKVVLENDCNFTIDADGIFAFKNNLNLLKKKNSKIIITPHYGEFSNLTGIETEEIKNNIFEVSTEFAKKYNLILVLKNSPSIITNGSEFYINSTGKENLATIGSGDVLSGIISGFYSLTKNSIRSAVSGTFMHGYCGDRLYEKSGASSTIASELISEIAKAKKSLVFN